MADVILADLINTDTATVIMVIIGPLLTAVAFLFHAYVAQIKAETKSVVVERDNWKNVADGAVVNLEKLANKHREDRGLPPIVEVAPVVPEHSSPTSDRQRETAELATMRARLVAAALSEGLEPRTIEEPE